MMIQPISASAAQYNLVRKLLQCGHAYATMESYDSAFRVACDNFAQAGTDADLDRWGKAAEAIHCIASMLFGLQWDEHRKAICKEITVSPDTI